MNAPAPFQQPPDAAARRQGIDTGASFLVQAPAGSGKTELLIQRMLALLANVDEPEEVVAITFTRKAASEMQDRILSALRAARGGDTATLTPQARTTRELALQVLARDEQAAWRLLEQPNRLRIETIDALANGLTRRMPWLARFGSMPEPVEDAEPLHRAAAGRALRALGDPDQPDAGAAVARLLAHLDNQVERATVMIAQMLARREEWLPFVVGAGGADQLDALRPMLEENLRQTISQELAALQRLAPPELWQLHAIPATVADWRSVAALVQRNDGEWRKRVPPEAKHRKRIFELVVPRLDTPANEAFRRALHAVPNLPEPRYTDQQWSLLKSLFTVLRNAAGHLRAVFQTRRQVDFTEISLAALWALGPPQEPTDLALAAGHRIRHLLVDEFQDTSELQHNLLLRLTAGWTPERTVFFVGDPMQSIYRFRNAEVGYFLDVRARGFGELDTVTPLQLTTNFRSQPGVVEWVNEVFAHILPANEDPASGAVPHAPSTAFRADSGAGEAVTLTVFDDLSDSAEARLVADQVTAARTADPNGRVAVLVRARTHLGPILAEFDRRGWKYRAVQVTTLAESSVVRDLLSLAKALVHFADRPAWLAILRAPWCGLSLADLHAIAGGAPQATIWSRLESPALALSADGAARLRRFLDALAPALRWRLRIPIRTLVEGTWIRLGGPACLHSSAEREDAAEFFQLLESFDVAGDLPDFDRIEQRLYILFTQPDPAADERLQVMTIHQAKGLEFETVILPGLGKPPKRQEPRLLLVSRHGGDLLVAPTPAPRGDPDPIYRYLERKERLKDEQESARLFYVAATRARERLHLIGHARPTASRGPVPVSGSFLQLLWPFVDASALRPADRSGSPRPPASSTIERLPLTWKPPERRADMRFHADANEAREVTFDWVGATLRSVGVVVHRYIQRIAHEGLRAWPTERVAGEGPAIRAALASQGVPAGDLAAATARASAAIQATLEDPMGRWTLDESHAEAQSELALSAAFESSVAHVVIDRTFVDETGTRWIIDYKTSQHEGAGLNAFLDNEVLRYTSQLEFYGRVMALGESRPVKLGLYFPLLRAWRSVG